MNRFELPIENQFSLFEQVREIEDVKEGDLFALIDSSLRGLVVHVANIVVFSPNDNVNPTLALLIDCVFEDLKNWTSSIVGIQGNITRTSDLLGLLYNQMGHARNQCGRLAGKRLSRADLLNPLVQFTLQRHRDGLFQGADKEAYKSKMMPSNVVRLSTVFRLLAQRLHSGHLSGFLAHFGGISDHQSTSIEFNSGEEIDTHGGPKPQKISQVP